MNNYSVFVVIYNTLVLWWIFKETSRAWNFFEFKYIYGW